jgi:hypothetical protein
MKLFSVALFIAVPAGAQNMIVNGGFEAGLSGWSVVGAPSGGAGGCAINWTAGSDAGTPGVYPSPSTPTGCMGVGPAYAGSLAAYNSFDGPGPLFYGIYQSFILPTTVTSATLSFTESAWHSIFAGSLPRTFRVNVGNGSTSLTPWAYIALPGGDFGAGLGHGWTSHSFDMSAFAVANAGGFMVVAFEATVPQGFTGPAGIGLDEVRFDVRAGVVPEPGSIVLLATGLVGMAGVAVRRRAKNS